MKWLALIPRYLPEKVGGNFIYVKMMTEALAKRGHEVHVVTTTRQMGLPTVQTVNDVCIHRVYVDRGDMGPAWFGATSKVTDYVLTLDENIGFDCINPHAAFMVDIGRLKQRHKHVIYTLHAVVTYEHLYRLKKIILGNLGNLSNLKVLVASPVLLLLSWFREIAAVTQADQIVVMSNYVKDTVERYLPFVDMSRVSVSRIGVDEKFFPPKDKARVREELGIGNEVILLTVRRIESRMGISNLVKAAAILAKKNVLSETKIYIVGKGSLTDEIQLEIRQLGLEKSVILLGFLPDDTLRLWYQAADAFVMPTEELEGFGIVTLEALASGLPVIATTAGANPEVAGRYYPDLLTGSKNSSSDLAASIQRYLCNKLSYRGDTVSVQVRADYAWSDIVSDLTRMANG